MVHPRLNFLICLLLAAMLAPARASTPETLNYRVYYKGLLSAMQELPIAEARLVTRRADDGRLEESTLTLSSAAHDVVDALYPIRYRLRALVDLQDDDLVATERFSRTRKLKHDLAWVDDDAGRLRYVRAGAGRPEPIPEALRPWVGAGEFGDPGKPVRAAPDGLLDRLSLVQALRRRIPAAGQVLTLPVTDGPKLYRYEVRLDGSETLQVAGRAIPAWRLRVVGFEHNDDGSVKSEPKHAPVYVWISRDAARTPLRFHIDHTAGGFTVEWVPGDLSVVVAMDEPIPGGGDDSWPGEG